MSPEIAREGLADVMQARRHLLLLRLLRLLYDLAPFPYRAIPDTSNGRAGSHRAASSAPTPQPTSSFPTIGFCLAAAQTKKSCTGA